MRARYIIAFLFTLTSLVSISQVESFSDFNSSLNEVTPDSVFKLIDQRLFDLEASKASEELIVETLLVKSDLADSVHNKMMSHYAVSELLNYRSFLSPEEYFNFLYKEGNTQLNISGVDVAMTYHFRAVTIADSIGNDTLLGKINKRIGINYLKSKNYDLSYKYLKRISMLRTLNNEILYIVKKIGIV